MKIFDYHYQWDFGHEWYLNLFCTNLFNLFQFNLNWSTYPGRLIFLLNIFGESFIGFSITIWKFDFSFDLLAYRQRDLNWYR
jgi:hypothetical protein